MGSAFASIIKELFGKYGLLLVDPMSPALRAIAAPAAAEAVERMPELADALITRSKELVERGYHAQVLVDKQTSLVFFCTGRQDWVALRRANGDFVAPQLKLTAGELAARGMDLSPNALLRPVMQDYLLPTAAYIRNWASGLAYLAQSQVLSGEVAGSAAGGFSTGGFYAGGGRAKLSAYEAVSSGA